MSEPRWLDEARKLIGCKEICGPDDNPEIVQMWKDIRRGGIKDDETPWCAAFVGAMLERSGVRSSRFESAFSYLDWGTRLIAPAAGCVVVFARTGGGHVGFVVGANKDGGLLVLGGNQNNEVSIKSFPWQRVVGFRWPEGEALPPQEPLAVFDAMESRDEA